MSEKAVTICSREIWDNWEAKQTYCENRFYKHSKFVYGNQIVRLGYWIDYIDGKRVEKLYLTTSIAILMDELSPNKLFVQWPITKKITFQITYRAGFNENKWAGWNLVTSGNLHESRQIFQMIAKKLIELAKS